MDHDDHVRLIRDGVEGAGTTWAELGSGTGAFTLALADLLGPGGTIHSVDRDGPALQTQAEAIQRRFPTTTLQQHHADFTVALDLAALDGLVMANSLHYVRDKRPLLALVAGYLRPGGRLILVEYDAEHGNPWVPYPISAARWPSLAASAGFEGTHELRRVPSRFLGAIYSALSLREGDSNEALPD